MKISTHREATEWILYGRLKEAAGSQEGWWLIALLGLMMAVSFASQAGETTCTGFHIAWHWVALSAAWVPFSGWRWRHWANESRAIHNELTRRLGGSLRPQSYHDGFDSGWHARDKRS